MMCCIGIGHIEVQSLGMLALSILLQALQRRCAVLGREADDRLLLAALGRWRSSRGLQSECGMCVHSQQTEQNVRFCCRSRDHKWTVGATTDPMSLLGDLPCPVLILGPCGFLQPLISSHGIKEGLRGIWQQYQVAHGA